MKLQNIKRSLFRQLVQVGSFYSALELVLLFLPQSPKIFLAVDSVRKLPGFSTSRKSSLLQLRPRNSLGGLEEGLALEIDENLLCLQEKFKAFQTEEVHSHTHKAAGQLSKLFTCKILRMSLKKIEERQSGRKSSIFIVKYYKYDYYRLGYYTDFKNQIFANL